MSITVQDYNQICVMSALADFVADVASIARKSVEEAIDQRQIVNFVVDFEKATFIDSEGLETLLWIKRKCEDLFGQVKLANLDENVHKILEMTRLEHRFECHNDLAAALKTMR